ncbi:MAG TPA: hypothetical protein VJR94_01140 [Candidatus Nitrosocosmicus sp.]|nr:hypothetical protein [Candidatus Nitrosocosmicus sp.]
MNKLNQFILSVLAMGIIALTVLAAPLAAAQTLTSTLTGKNNSEEMRNTPKGMQNMSFSANDVRNQTIGMDNIPAFNSDSPGSVDLKINQ